MGVSQLQGVTPKRYFPPLLLHVLHDFFRGFPLIFCLFCSASDGKSCFSVRKSISTSKQHAEHPYGVTWHIGMSGTLNAADPDLIPDESNALFS